MKKILFLVCSLPLLIFSQEISINGGHGMFKMQYARPHNMGMLSFHISPEWRYEPFEVTDRKHFLELNNGISYAILDYLETRFRVTSFAKYYERHDLPVIRKDAEPPIGFKTFEFGLKAGYPFIVDQATPLYYAIGIDGYIDFSSRLSNTGLIPNARANDSALYIGSFEGDAPHFPPYLPHKPDYDFTALFDFRIGPFATHLNVGYLITGEDENPGYVTPADFNQLQRPNLLTHGIGFELIPSDVAKIIFEANGYFNTATKAESLWVTPGLRLGTQAVSFDLGCELGIQGTWYWKPFFNFSFGTDLARKVAAHVPTAIVSGKVYDAKTEEPVAATITFPGSTKAAVQTAENGTYDISFDPGTYRFHIDASDYRWKEQGILLKDGDHVILDFQLNRIEIVRATLTGQVTDAEDGKPIFAKITLMDTTAYVVQTDPTTGIYKAVTSPGIYSVKAEADYYLMESVPIILAKDETKMQNFALKKVPKVGEKIILKGIYFDFNSAIIKPESYPVLDDAAKVLKAKPNMRIEIGGHTDSVGSGSYNQTLSYKRAQSVKDYLVKNHNIDPARLEVRGYGESQPIADNRSKSGRDLNRRIEFKILSVE